MLMRPCVKCWKGARAFSSGVNLLHEGLRLQHLGDWAAALSAFRGAAQNSPMLGAAANNAEGLLLLRSSVPVAHGTRELQRGDVLLAPWAEDGFDYEAILEEMDEASDTCTVAWSDGGQTCRVVPRAAVTTLQGLSHRDDRATRLWASRRALRRALLDWQGQAEAGVAHDAFVDFAGLVCDLAAAEIRIALISSWPGLELAQNLLKRGSFTAERAYAPDPRALAALYSTRAEVLRFNSGANLREVQLLHLRVADHLRAASWRDKPRWESPAGHLGWEILHEVQWAKALAQMAWSEQAQPRSRPNASTKRRKAQVPATASVWALPEKLLPPTPGLPRGPDLLLHHSCALQSVGRAWRALHWAAHRDAPKSLPWTYSAESVRDFVATLPVTAVHVRLLLEVAILVFVIGCRSGHPRRSRQVAFELLLACRLDLALREDAELVQHAMEILSGQDLSGMAKAPTKFQRVRDPSSASLRRRWQVAGYRAQDELWLLRCGGGRLATLSAPAPFSWAMEGVALAETLPER
ncbi:unnamed protein product [Durusdinium trenchii]|uniref:Pentatricopeptide repeat-containing protein n=3 Tax=Durusdinium trenchii TaxID=1381693 RepID=A0ABP0HRT0_9DINO